MKLCCRVINVKKNKCLEDDRQKVFIYSVHECECLSAVVDARFPASIHQVLNIDCTTFRTSWIKNVFSRYGIPVCVHQGPKEYNRTCGPHSKKVSTWSPLGPQGVEKPTATQ